MIFNDKNLTINNRIILIDDNEKIHHDFQKALTYKEDDDHDKKLADLENLLFAADAIQNNPPNAYQNKEEAQDYIFQIDFASQGKQGYEKVVEAYQQGNPYSLAFLDIRMPPGWDGIETAERILQEEPYIQLVLCTAHSDYSWSDMSRLLVDNRRWMLLKKPYDIIEVKQIAIAFSIKWTLEREMEMEIHKRTKRLELMNEDLQEKIDSLTSAKKTIKQLAYYDELTELPNRRFFMGLLNYSLKNMPADKARMALLYVDIDNFKRVNDSLGHVNGDILLKKFVERVTSCIRMRNAKNQVDYDQAHENDNYFARMGGDEFVILIKNYSNLEDINKIANRIHEVLREPIDISDMSVHVTCSIGISSYPDDSKDVDALLLNADMAMYLAKTTGKAHTKFYDSDFNLVLQSQLDLENSLRKAYKEKEFDVYYQPINDIKTDHIIGFEALLRWHSKDRGCTMETEQFITVLENSHLIVDVSNWVMETACSQCKTWQDEYNFKFYICVNLSSQQLALGQKFVDIVESALRTTGLEPQYLHIEVTERILILENTTLLHTLYLLKGLGIKVSIDDFGTGYTSLRYLNELPIDTIKFDKYYIANLKEDVSCRKIVDSMLALCKKLDLKVVAEGIENKSEIDHLKLQECDAGQGFYFQRPASALDMDKILAEHNESKRAI